MAKIIDNPTQAPLDGLKIIYFNLVPTDWLSDRIYTELPADQILGDELMIKVANVYIKHNHDESKFDIDEQQDLLNIYRISYQLFYHSAINYDMRHKLRIINRGIRLNEHDKLELYLGPIIIKAIRKFKPVPGIKWSRFCAIFVTQLISKILNSRPDTAARLEFKRQKRLSNVYRQK